MVWLKVSLGYESLIKVWKSPLHNWNKTALEQIGGACRDMLLFVSWKSPIHIFIWKMYLQHVCVLFFRIDILLFVSCFIVGGKQESLSASPWCLKSPIHVNWRELYIYFISSWNFFSSSFVILFICKIPFLIYLNISF